jgi:hypothetical protein
MSTTNGPDQGDLQRLTLVAIADWADHEGHAEVRDEDLEAVCATPSASLAWFDQMLQTMHQLPPEDRAAFDRWDNTQVGPGKPHRSSDWPGWARYLPPPPWKAHATREDPA